MRRLNREQEMEFDRKIIEADNDMTSVIER